MFALLSLIVLRVYSTEIDAISSNRCAALKDSEKEDNNGYYNGKSFGPYNECFSVEGVEFFHKGEGKCRDEEGKARLVILNNDTSENSTTKENCARICSYAIKEFEAPCEAFSWANRDKGDCTIYLGPPISTVSDKEKSVIKTLNARNMSEG